MLLTSPPVGVLEVAGFFRWFSFRYSIGGGSEVVLDVRGDLGGKAAAPIFTPLVPFLMNP